MRPGWINRQFARVEKDYATWPEWMRRETEKRIAAATCTNPVHEPTAEAATATKQSVESVVPGVGVEPTPGIENT